MTFGQVRLPCHLRLRRLCGRNFFLSNFAIHFNIVFAVGVVCYLCLSDRFPFNAKNRQDLFQKIAAGNLSFPASSWDAVSEDAKDFIKQLLMVDSNNRPSAEKALQHAWLATARKSKIIGNPKFEPTNDVEKLNNQLAALKTMNALDNLKRATPSKQKEVIKTFIASQLLLSDEKKAINTVFQELGKLYAQLFPSPL